MAVHTVLSAADVERLADLYRLGPVVRWRGLAEGSINSNFEVFGGAGRFFLTLREGKTAADVEFEVRLLSHLSRARFPVPRPLPADGGPVGQAHGRPVLVFPWVSGEQLGAGEVTPDHLRELGEHLARMHLLLEALPADRPNPYGPGTLARWFEELRATATGELRGLLPELEEELAWVRAHRNAGLARGLVHADLFLDNVKWIGGRLAALLDFEMACRDVLALDLAIVLLAWCHPAAAFDRPLLRAFLSGYGARRPLDEEERQGLYAETRFAALRYTLSRIRDFELSPLPAERLQRKDYREYLGRLRGLRTLGPVRFLELCGFLGRAGGGESR